jgi:fructuronate reductase
MNPQDGLYALAERDGTAARTRVIGAVRGVLVAGEDPEAVIARGRCAGDADCHAHDHRERLLPRCARRSRSCAGGRGAVSTASSPKGWRGGAQAGLPGLTLLSCDNLADNGQVAGAPDGPVPRAASTPIWPHGAPRTCTFPSTMVDRIVPATTDADRAEVGSATSGCAD